MKTAHLLAPLFLLAGLTLTAAAADTTVTLSNVHICCGKCVTGINTAVAPITGAKAVGDIADKTVVITAPDKVTAQKAVNALTAAGYFGKSSDDTIKVDAVTAPPDAKVSTLEVSSLPLCCNSCVTAVNANALFDEFQKAGLTGKVAPTAK